jgi:hypothetical protein
MEMRTRGWMIWMAMAMNVVEAEQEDGVCQYCFAFEFGFLCVFRVSYCCVHLIYNMIG